MTTPDPRLAPVREGRASARLEGVLPARSYLEPAVMTPRSGWAALRRTPAPDAEQCDQLLFGERFEVLETADGWCFGQATRDGYVGWVEAAALTAAPPPPTYRVARVAAAVLAAPDPRAPALHHLPMNALVAVEAREGGFARAAGLGWLPLSHLAPVGVFEADPAAVAELWTGTPYVWGGRGGLGIDCSGLVQAALFACGRACPRDSDQQAGLGEAVTASDLGRGDLVVWPGHIGLMLDESRLVHASGVQMAVVVELLAEAVAARRATVGEPTAFRRLGG